MADELPPASAVAFPAVETIPQAAIERWVGLSNDALIDAHLTKRDIDRLYFCLQGLSSGILNLQFALIEEAQGLGHASTRPQFANSRLAAVNALNSLTHFMTKIMEKGDAYGG